MNFNEFLNSDITIHYGGQEWTVKGRDFDASDLVDKYLSSGGVYADNVYKDGFFYLCVDIHWGDWKHEHLRADYLMGQIGYSLHHDVLTEENGSDCYSAIHYYVKSDIMDAIEKMREKM